MKILIKTKVQSPMPDVWTGFDKNLFVKLSPPFPKVEILRFDGCLKGHHVQLKLLFPFFSQYWFVEIIDSVVNVNESYFIDKGTRLPFFLSKWQHKHLIKRSNDNECFIIDDIDFNTGTVFTDWVLFPLMYAQFLMRVPVYKKYFQK